MTGEIIRSLERSSKVPPSKAMFQFQNSKGLGDFWRANADDPRSSLGALIMGLGAESAAPMLISSGSTLVGTAAGGPAGGALGGAVGGALPEYLATYQEELLSRVDGEPTEEKLIAILRDPEFQAEVDRKAATRAGTIAGVDEISETEISETGQALKVDTKWGDPISLKRNVKICSLTPAKHPQR